MKIKYYENGFEIVYMSSKRCFIAYQSIVKIHDVLIGIDNSGFDWLTQRYMSDNVSKYCYFKIDLANESSIEIVLDNGYKYFRRFDWDETKKLPWIKRIFLCDLNHEGLDKQAELWLTNKQLDMFDIIEETNIVRNELITNFNNWKK